MIPEHGNRSDETIKELIARLPWAPESLDTLESEKEEAKKIDLLSRTHRGAEMIRYVLTHMESIFKKSFSEETTSPPSLGTFRFFPQHEQEGQKLIKHLLQQGINPQILFVESSSDFEKKTIKASLHAGITKKLINNYRTTDSDQLKQWINSAILLAFRTYVDLTGRKTFQESWPECVTKEDVSKFLEFTATMNLGVMADGWWRNQVGEKAVQLFINEIEKALKKLYSKKSYRFEPNEDSPSVREYIVTNTTNETQLIFRFGEPDFSVKIRNEKMEKILLLGEIKGRFDKSNLQESWYTTIQNRMGRAGNEGKNAASVFVLVQNYFVKEEKKQINDLLNESEKKGLKLGLFSLAKLMSSQEERRRFEECIKGLIDLLEL
uniref:Restriction endonuclease n=1 Tax=Thermus sp. 4C TaxID=446041 RepID=A6MN81_9DEIN|nr:hypothetical protein [Thermus sp. 4C]ABQ95625.1 hypothetical protein [Thermus sp. 4C]